MDKEAVEDLFDISSEQLACVNGAEPGMGLIRFGDKIVPLDNTIEKDNNLYQLFNTNFHEMVKVLDNTVHRIYNTDIRYTV
jgi:CRISPR/Cas system CMR subunit Cmr4 (Cas7 group RAMP superfamily)